MSSSGYTCLRFKRAGPDLKRVIEAEIRRMLYDEVISFEKDRIYLASEAQ